MMIHPILLELPQLTILVSQHHRDTLFFFFFFFFSIDILFISLSFATNEIKYFKKVLFVCILFSRCFCVYIFFLFCSLLLLLLFIYTHTHIHTKQWWFNISNCIILQKWTFCFLFSHRDKWQWRYIVSFLFHEKTHKRKWLNTYYV